MPQMIEEESITEIEEILKRMSPDKRNIVYQFIVFLDSHQARSEAWQTMLASEEVLRKDWDSPEEDAAWADL
ncbi:MAG: hypothetical protein P9M15_07925 [Candidatus Electryoneaceae bacterium]|nr:hypothetical protein [Candidatus Electryoneaceae bacterium]